MALTPRTSLDFIGIRSAATPRVICVPPLTLAGCLQFLAPSSEDHGANVARSVLAVERLVTANYSVDECLSGIEFNLDYYFTPLKWTHLRPCSTILFLRYDLKRTTTKTKLRIVTFCPRQPYSQNDHHSDSIANVQHDSPHAMDALMVYCDVLPSFYLLSTTLALCHRIVQETDLNLPGATSFSSKCSLYDCLQGHIGPSHSSQPSSYDVMLAFSCSKASDLDVDVIRALCKSCSAIDIVC